MWDRRTGQPYHNAIVWQDTRTAQLVGELDRSGQGDLIRERAGIPPATYFAGGKLAWLLQNVDGLRAAAESGDALFGTIDTWLLWNLTGGIDGGQHLTDVTNASRTMLMNLAELRWDPDLLELFDIPEQLLPTIVPSSHAEKPSAPPGRRSAGRSSSVGCSVTSTPRWSARCASTKARRRTPTAPATSC